MNISSITRRLAAALMIALVAVAPLAAGQGHRGGKGKGGEKMIERIIQRLDLTQEQQTRIAAIRDQFKTQHATLIAEVKAAHEQMRDARKAGDKARAEQIRSTMAPKMEQLRTAREQMKEQILAVLTPEQRAELETMKAERKQKRGRMEGKAEKAPKVSKQDARID